MLYPPSILDEWTTAQRHVARCRELVKRQIEIVRTCRQQHWSEQDATILLRELCAALRIGRHHARVVERELGRR